MPSNSSTNNVQQGTQTIGGQLTHLLVLVLLDHSAISLLFSNDLAAVLDNNLLILERPVCANTKASIASSDNIHANVELVALGGASSQIGKIAVSAQILADVTVVFCTLIDRGAVGAARSTAVLRLALALVVAFVLAT